MTAMFFPTIENNPDAAAPHAGMIKQARAAGQELPQIWHLFAFKPAATNQLAGFTQAVMRGPSPLSAGMRELIAAFTSKLNRCPY